MGLRDYSLFPAKTPQAQHPQAGISLPAYQTQPVILQPIFVRFFIQKIFTLEHSDIISFHPRPIGGREKLETGFRTKLHFQELMYPSFSCLCQCTVGLSNSKDQVKKCYPKKIKGKYMYFTRMDRIVFSGTKREFTSNQSCASQK